MQPRQADELLGELGHLRRRARRAPGRPWPAMVGFGAAAVGGAGVLALHVPGAYAAWWLLVGAAGSRLLRRSDRRQAEARGVARPWRGAAAGFVVVFVVALLTATLGGLGLTLAVTAAAVWVAYAAISLRRRDPLPAIALAPGLGAAVVAAALGGPPWLVELLAGGTMLGVGLLLRRLGRRDEGA